MRPRCLAELVGQQHLVGPGKPLRALIEADRLSSCILWGPAGTGKTTTARLVAHATAKAFEPMSAVTAGVKEAGRSSSGPSVASASRTKEDPVPRRDPPLQPHPAGRLAPARGGRAPHADRGDDRKSLLREWLTISVVSPQVPLPADHPRPPREGGTIVATND
ncbi:MAG: AAA family ATPase [Acidimicrobiia bacterium]